MSRKEPFTEGDAVVLMVFLILVAGGIFWVLDKLGLSFA